MTKELAEKKCYELIHEALRIAREVDPEIYHISCFIIDDGPNDCFTNIVAYKYGEEEDVKVLDYSINE